MTEPKEYKTPTVVAMHDIDAMPCCVAAAVGTAVAAVASVTQNNNSRNQNSGSLNFKTLRHRRNGPRPRITRETRRCNLDT